jgi:molybdopterin-containing oxidoreductase family iron-sulfur binding subunit
MSTLDQCHSTTAEHAHGGEVLPSKQDLARSPRELTRIAGRKAWRSADELADTSEFRDFVEREFPAGITDMLTSSRRTFLQLMGASVALAGAATLPGCRRPDHKILPYSREIPEDVVIGKPLFYASAMALPGGGAEGLLIETHEGRPTKVEGNPLHAVNQGKSSIWAQASVLSLYDPDRLKYPMYKNPARGRLEATFDDFKAWWGPESERLLAARGSTVAILVDKKTSPTRDALKADLKKKWPAATWIAYDATQNTSAVAGSRIAFGKPMREVLDLAKAKVIVSLDRDFLSASGPGFEPGGLVNARGFAANRAVMKTSDDMCRLYVVECQASLTGGLADHRKRVAPSVVTHYAFALAAALSKLGVSGLNGVVAKGAIGAIDTKFVDAAAEDLLASKGASLVVAGPSQPAEVHAITHAINAALGNAGKTVAYRNMSEDEASDGLADLSTLAARMGKGEIDTVICIGVNPVYDAPGDLGFAEKFAKVKNTITWSVESTETANESVWTLNGAHALESWSDIEAIDGTRSVVQPMIAPLYSKPEDASGPAAVVFSEIEFLAFLGGNLKPDGLALVKSTWSGALGAGPDGEKKWRRILHEGRTATAVGPAAPGPLKMADVASAASAFTLPTPPSQSNLDVVFEIGMVGDGRFGNNPWLHELPQPGTRVVWENPALMSPKTAEALGVAPLSYNDGDPNEIYTDRKFPKARLAEIAIAGRKVTVACWVCPGMADDTVVLTFGYGRTSCGSVGENVGSNVYPLRGGGISRFAQGAKIALAEGTREVASTQNHWSLEGRTTLVREVDLAAWKKHGDTVKNMVDSIYGKEAEQVNFAEQLGELSHTPPNVSIYKNPYNLSDQNPDPTNKGAVDHLGNPAAAQYTKRQQWGMTIDLASCTGCGTCTIACQSENNIPVVGRDEVAKGRELTWIRVDRYYTGDDINEPSAMMHQPVGCVHCENAPCETVCPVNATVHGPEGINYQVYNRCIGTRYCANNCPYKVRRYNFFEFGISKFNGGFYGKELADKVGGIPNVNWIPPRLREKVDEISRMQRNPDVSVRMRGVMEKCSYCIQRINAARAEMKLENLQNIPEGFFQSACQQACPSNAIVFGDINDPESKVSKTRANGRSYLLLGYLNTRPRTSYLMGVKNPNPKLRASIENPQDHGHDDHGHDHDHDHDHKHDGKGHSHFIDPRKRFKDVGYALSLSVLS